MGRSFNYARGAKTIPPVQSLRYATGQTFKKYALVVDDANGEIVECGADPTAVLGVTMQAANSGLGYGEANSADTVVATGRLQEVSTVIADRNSEFSARGVNGGTDPVTPLQSHIGEQYGVSKIGDDWVIDLAETTTKVVEITDIISENGQQFFLCKFLEAVLSRP